MPAFVHVTKYPDPDVTQRKNGSRLTSVFLFLSLENRSENRPLIPFQTDQRPVTVISQLSLGLWDYYIFNQANRKPVLAAVGGLSAQSTRLEEHGISIVHIRRIRR